MNTNLQFNNPAILLLLWLIPFIIWLWIKLHKRSENKLKQFISGTMQTKLRFPISKYKLLIQAATISLGLALLTISVAGPFAGDREQTVTQMGHDIIILLDVSSSMTAKDMQPSRLDRAKSTIIETASKLKQDRLALLAFRNKATLLCPLTYDREFLYQATKLASINSAPAGETDIGNAIISASKLFNTNSSAHKIILLFSDGEDLAGNIPQALSLAVKNNITIYTVGIGQTAGTIIPDPLQPEQPYVHNGKKVITRLNELTLQKIAKTSGGKYTPLNKINDIPYSDICKEYLRAIKAEEAAKTMKKLRHYRYNQFLLPAFFLLLFALIISRKKKSIPHSHSTPKALILFLALTTTFLTTNKSICRAEETPTDEQKFNTAVTLFSSNNYQKAITILDTIKADNNNIPLNSAYGCTYFRMAQLTGQIELYKKAAESFQAVLINNPNNAVAEHNLAIAYTEMQAAAKKLKKASPTSNKIADKQQTIKTTNTNLQHQTVKQKTEKHPATGSPKKNKDLSNKEIDDILSAILNREKEYQAQKQKYGKIIPLKANIKDW